MKDLAERLSDWVAAGLIDEQQAQSIGDFESASGSEQRVSLVAQVLGYVGGILALVALFVLVGQAWSEISTWMRLGIVATGTAIFLIAGWAIRRNGLTAIQLVASFLWALSVVGVAFFFGLIADASFEAAEETTVLVASAAGLASALVLYVIARLSLQQLMLWAAVVATAMSTIAKLDGGDTLSFGTALWGIGILWLMLGWRNTLVPRQTAYALGSVLLLIGPQLMFIDRWPLFLGILSAGALLGLSVALRNSVLLGFGAAGVFLFAPQIIFEFFGDTLGAPLALFLAGVTLVGAAILVARLRTEVVSDGD